jgi:S-adenosylmethionine uptake transporter
MSKPTSTAVAFGVASLGIALFSGMDALMKAVSLEIGAYNALLWRTLVSAVMAGGLFLALRKPWPAGPAFRVHLTRGLISLPMAMLFFWGLARVPMAQAIALSFVAPLLSLYLAAVLLGERIERQAIIASALGFGGVLMIFQGQAEADLGPEALAGSAAILCSAGFYAYNIILMRRQALLADRWRWPSSSQGSWPRASRSPRRCWRSRPARTCGRRSWLRRCLRSDR